MANVSNAVPEWHSDESGIVRLVDPAGRPRRYQLKRLVPYGKRVYVVLEPSLDNAPFLVGEYIIGWNGDAWVAPVFHSLLTFVILCLGIARDREARTHPEHEV
ncbi:MAG: hypothetical protein QG626_571 [Patescibacteria group bacterium]|jgi:hypothetical protein|nr:hypothetical protein [Patescibacteria group bacterium]